MRLILIAAMFVVGLTVLLGFYYIKKEDLNARKQMRKYLRVNLMVYVPLMLVAIMILVPQIVYAADDAAGSSTDKGIGLIAAALSTGMATIGAGYAVGAVGSSALGAVSEDPKILGKTLIFVGLAEGIAIYGLIISILILGQL
ncbi:MULTISPECIES: ATP synthase subunit C [unclassified Fusibacter]|uniref:ATP synthase subunit C n=1 Tax=unclassified Fusibacter TaxID=2624464 RepID=UPI00101148D5|nr:MULTISPECIES: ATP synthase subunit C [unclassified Fusibacter]MCK8059888.1 ATP synthase subunit C [Fusibacter sp. A2]NPE21690.1 ATPase [Fusibacter sp. A1]RXV62093.1 ATPase [Fusibacter sp. A1]